MKGTFISLGSYTVYESSILYWLPFHVRRSSNETDETLIASDTMLSSVYTFPGQYGSYVIYILVNIQYSWQVVSYLVALATLSYTNGVRYVTLA